MAEAYAALLQIDPRTLLAPLVAAEDGALVDVAREDLVYRPGKDAHVRFSATLERDGRTRRQGWVVCVGGAPHPGGRTVAGPSGPLPAWRVRDDPSLPGLRLALDRAAVRTLLTELGAETDGLTIELLAYRPQRRAVVVARTRTHELYLKCVPPEKADALHRRHVACRTAGVPSPRAVGYDPALGILVLTPVQGTSLRPGLLAPDTALVDPQAVVGVLEAFGAVELDERARSSVRQVSGHARLLRAVLPQESSRLDELVARVRTARPDEPRRVVHGDFYDGQLLARDGVLVGVVDVDGTGLGHPAEDPGNLLAHLLVLRQTFPPPASVHRWLPPLLDAVLPRYDLLELGRHTAAVLVGLATWPHSRQSDGWQAQTSAVLDLAEQALDGRF